MNEHRIMELLHKRIRELYFVENISTNQVTNGDSRSDLNDWNLIDWRGKDLNCSTSGCCTFSTRNLRTFNAMYTIWAWEVVCIYRKVIIMKSAVHFFLITNASRKFIVNLGRFESTDTNSFNTNIFCLLYLKNFYYP